MFVSDMFFGNENFNKLPCRKQTKHTVNTAHSFTLTFFTNTEQKLNVNTFTYVSEMSKLVASFSNTFYVCLLFGKNQFRIAALQKIH